MKWCVLSFWGCIPGCHVVRGRRQYLDELDPVVRAWTTGAPCSIYIWYIHIRLAVPFLLQNLQRPVGETLLQQRRQAKFRNFEILLLVEEVILFLWLQDSVRDAATMEEKCAKLDPAWIPFPASCWTSTWASPIPWSREVELKLDNSKMVMCVLSNGNGSALVLKPHEQILAVYRSSSCNSKSARFLNRTMSYWWTVRIYPKSFKNWSQSISIIRQSCHSKIASSSNLLYRC